MERMHPQDLRALMAAIITAQDYQPYRELGCEARIVKDTDNLLAELERTAKPEDEPLDAHHCACGRPYQRAESARLEHWKNRTEKAEARLNDMVPPEQLIETLDRAIKAEAELAQVRPMLAHFTEEAERLEGELREVSSSRSYWKDCAERSYLERTKLRAWQVAVAEGLGFLNRPEGQSGYEVAEPKVLLDYYDQLRVALDNANAHIHDLQEQLQNRDAEAQVDRLKQALDAATAEMVAWRQKAWDNAARAENAEAGQFYAKSGWEAASKSLVELEKRNGELWSANVDKSTEIRKLREELEAAVETERERIAVLIESWGLKNMLGYRVGGLNLRNNLTPDYPGAQAIINPTGFGPGIVSHPDYRAEQAQANQDAASAVDQMNMNPEPKP